MPLDTLKRCPDKYKQAISSLQPKLFQIFQPVVGHLANLFLDGTNSLDF